MSNVTDEELLVEFLDESIQSLRSLPDAFAKYCDDPESSDLINSVFRAIHSIKGSAGFFGLTEIKKFAHSLENTLDQLRQGKIAPIDDLKRGIISGIDHLEQWLQSNPTAASDSAFESTRARILSQIETAASHARIGEFDVLLQIEQLQREIELVDSPHSSVWVSRLGEIRRIIDPSNSAEASSTTIDGPTKDSHFAKYLDVAFTSDGEDVTKLITPLLPLFIETQAGRYTSTLGADFFKAVDDLAIWSELHGKSNLRENLEAARTQFQTLYNSPLTIDSLLLSIVWESLEPIFNALSSTKDSNKVTPTTPPKSSAELSEKGAAAHFIRIREDRLEGFMNDVSRLFITSERLRDFERRATQTLQNQPLTDEIREIGAALNVQVSELQKGVAALRKVPVKALFSKFPRVARTLAESLGKRLSIHFAGEDLEIDKALIEDLEAPLTHMVRNVCDHGIELPHDRTARGVSEEGNLWLECELTRTNVVLRIRDDGRGIDPARLRTKAIEKGLLTPAQAAALSDAEAIDLIFHAGFSTAEKVSDVSGRGVGMDVVRTNVVAHGGSVKVESVINQGTTFILQIPNRKAVLVVEGILLEEAKGRFVAPFENVSEIISIEAANCATVQGKPVVIVRGKPIAAAKLSTLLGMTHDDSPIVGRSGLVLHNKRGRLCLVVDRVLGQRKVVVSPIQTLLPTAHQIGGVAQLGGNELALVLNVSEMIDFQSIMETND